MSPRLSLAALPILLAPAMAEAGTLHRGEYPTTVPEGPLPDEPVTEEGKAILAEVSACVADPEKQTGVSLHFIPEKKRVATEVAVGEVNADDATWNCVMNVAKKHGFFEDRDDRDMTHPYGDQSLQFLRLSETLSDAEFATAQAASDVKKALPYKKAERSHGYGAEGPLPGMQFGSEYLVQPHKPDGNWMGAWPATYEAIGFMAQQTKRNDRDFGMGGPSDDLVTDEIRVPFSPEHTTTMKHGVLATGEGYFKDGTRVEFQTIACNGGDKLDITVVTPSGTFPVTPRNRVSAPGLGRYSRVQNLVWNHAWSGGHLLPKWEAELFCAAEGNEKEEAARDNARREKLRAKELAEAAE